jgi:hypothetical protein
MRGHILAGVIIILIGLSILFGFPLFNFIFAFIVLWIGVRILTGQGKHGHYWPEGKGSSNEDYFRRVLVFSDRKSVV